MTLLYGILFGLLLAIIVDAKPKSKGAIKLNLKKEKKADGSNSNLELSINNFRRLNYGLVNNKMFNPDKIPVVLLLQTNNQQSEPDTEPDLDRDQVILSNPIKVKNVVPGKLRAKIENLILKTLLKSLSKDIEEEESEEKLIRHIVVPFVPDDKYEELPIYYKIKQIPEKENGEKSKDYDKDESDGIVDFNLGKVPLYQKAKYYSQMRKNIENRYENLPVYYQNSARKSNPEPTQEAVVNAKSTAELGNSWNIHWK